MADTAVFSRTAPRDSDISEEYGISDFYLCPSSSEGFGLPILEAERCGVPVFVRKAAKISNEIKECTVQCKSKSEMAEKIYALLTDESLYREISKRAHEYSKKFTWEECAKKTIEVYEKVARK